MVTTKLSQDFLQEALDVALLATKEAEKITMNYFGTDLFVADEKENQDKTSKHYKSPATIADQEAEAAIKEIIKKKFPHHGFLGEEEGSEGDSDFVWIIDPIDGTKAYMRGMDNWAILIALQYKKEVLLGVSLLPVINELIYAAQGMGCFCNNKKCSVSSRPLNEAFISHERYKYFKREGMEKSLEKLRGECAYYIANKTPRQFHYLLQGKIDCILGPTNLYLYDVAPYAIMLKEAGGFFTTLKNTEVCDEHTSFLASNKVLHADVLKFFS